MYKENVVWGWPSSRKSVEIDVERYAVAVQQSAAGPKKNLLRPRLDGIAQPTTGEIP